MVDFIFRCNQEHLVSVHKYPANFRFNRPTRKQKKKLAEEGSEDMEITSEKVYS